MVGGGARAGAANAERPGGEIFGRVSSTPFLRHPPRRFRSAAHRSGDEWMATRPPGTPGVRLIGDRPPDAPGAGAENCKI
jgi:hypothetical protein